MEFSWTEEQHQGYQQALDFARRELRWKFRSPDVPDVDWLARWQRCARFGLQSLNIPARYGGLELNARSAVHVLEGLGRGCDDNGLLLALGAQLWSVNAPLIAFATEEQKQTWLPLFAQGSAVGAFALTEPECGSDILRLRTRARPERDGYRLNGVKSFITNAPVATLFVVLALTQENAGYFGLTAFLVRAGSEGVHVGPALRKMGLESSPMAELRLQDAWLPASAVLGQPGGGGAVLLHTLEWERGCLLAPALGTMDRLLESTAAYARSRKQFGRPIVEFEAVARHLAEMRVRLQLSRLLSYEFGWCKDEGLSASTQASMVKLYVSESLRRVCELALHLHGAAGYMRELEFERAWRDAMASSLYSGTTEMQSNLIAESLLRTPATRHEQAAP